jgi:hypothetical protein
MTAVPPGRAGRPEDGVLSRGGSSFATAAPCVLASERPSQPGSERNSAKPSYCRSLPPSTMIEWPVTKGARTR